MCYANLLAGRSTGVSTSTSPGQTAQPGKYAHAAQTTYNESNDRNFRANHCLFFTAVSDDEAEVPSRNLIKRQALLLVDSKARRKGYRAPPKRK